MRTKPSKILALIEMFRQDGLLESKAIQLSKSGRMLLLASDRVFFITWKGLWRRVDPDTGSMYSADEWANSPRRVGLKAAGREPWSEIRPGRPSVRSS